MPAEDLCTQVAEAIPMFGAGEELPRDFRDHLEQCLMCQGALARDRRLLRLLGELASEPLPVPSGLVAEVLYHLSQSATKRAMRSMLAGKKVAYLGGVLVGLFAVGAVVVVAKARRPHSARPAHGFAKPPSA